MFVRRTRAHRVGEPQLILFSICSGGANLCVMQLRKSLPVQSNASERNLKEAEET